MFAEIAPSYDRVNGLLSFNLHHSWRRAAVKAIEVAPGERVLDLCCGTGDFASVLAERVGASGGVVGLDFCLPMLQVAVGKGVRSALWGLADACRLPLGDAQFDAVTVGWGLRNVPELDSALAEAARVLRPGGRFATLDMAKPETPVFGPLAEAGFHVAAPMVGRWVGHSDAYTYLPKSTERFVSRAELRRRMERVGFVRVRQRSFCFGNVCLMWGVKG